MEGFLVIVAIIVLTIVQNASRTARGPRGRVEGGGPDEPDPSPRSRRGARAADPEAERLRREAYAAIREMLGGGGGEGRSPVEEPAKADEADWTLSPEPVRETAPVRRRATASTLKPRVPRPVRPPHAVRLRRFEEPGRAIPDEAGGARTGGRRRSAGEFRVEPPSRTSRRTAPGLRRLDRLPRLPRAILYAELLGRPAALRSEDPDVPG